MIAITDPNEEPPSVSTATAEPLPAPSAELATEPTSDPDLAETPRAPEPNKRCCPRSRQRILQIRPLEMERQRKRMPATAVAVSGDSTGPNTNNTPPAKEEIADAEPLGDDVNADSIEKPMAAKPLSPSEPTLAAKVSSSAALLAMMDGDRWVELRKGAPINTGSALVCADFLRRGDHSRQSDRHDGRSHGK